MPLLFRAVFPLRLVPLALGRGLDRVFVLFRKLAPPRQQDPKITCPAKHVPFISKVCELGGTGLEPVTSCMSSTVSKMLYIRKSR
jgi:hypothetical protein